MEQELTSLDEALGEPSEAVETPVDIVEEVKTEAVEPATESSPPEESWTKTAVMDERNKRQTAQTELEQSRQLVAKYEGYLQGLNPQQPAEKPLDFYDDPDGYVNSTVGKLEERFSQQLQKSQAQTTNQVLNMSEAMVSGSYEDFPQVKAHFMELAKSNPAVVQQIKDSPHPWLAAYQIGKQSMDLKEVGDVDGYRTKVREELKAEVMAEMKAEMEASGQKMTVPQSLVNQPSKGPVKASDWGGPTSLDDALR